MSEPSMPNGAASVALATAFPVDASLGQVVGFQPACDRSGDPRSRHLAVVHTADEIRFSATSNDREELVAALAEYVSRHATDRLWPREADRVRTLLACGDCDAAIAAYFASVGQRWDEEWLVTAIA